MSVNKIHEKLRKLEESLLEGRITEDTYRELKKKYQEELFTAKSSLPPIKARTLGLTLVSIYFVIRLILSILLGCFLYSWVTHFVW